MLEFLLSVIFRKTYFYDFHSVKVGMTAYNYAHVRTVPGVLELECGHLMWHQGLNSVLWRSPERNPELPPQAQISGIFCHMRFGNSPSFPLDMSVILPHFRAQAHRTVEGTWSKKIQVQIPDHYVVTLTNGSLDSVSLPVKKPLWASQCCHTVRWLQDSAQNSGGPEWTGVQFAHASVGKIHENE